MSIIWSDQALDDLESIKAYIAKDSVEAANREIGMVMIHAESQLRIFPTSGRAGRIKGTYKLVIPRTPYIVIYRLKEKQIEIARIHHSSQLWPDQF
jgi:toxin ParE1/3/4